MYWNETTDLVFLFKTFKLCKLEFAQARTSMSKYPYTYVQYFTNLVGYLVRVLSLDFGLKHIYKCIKLFELIIKFKNVENSY